MKQALNILIAYLTCTDPVIQNKWLNLLNSFWHKDSGWLLKSITAQAGGYKFTIVDSGGNDVDHIISVPALPNSQPISYIQDLQTTLDNKVDKAAGKGLSTNDFTTTLKNKLDGLANYVHPEFHQISEIDGLQALLETLAVYDNLADVAKTNNYNDLDGKPVFKVVENEYADMAALYADQGNQTESFIQYVADASAHTDVEEDPDVEKRRAYFEYFGTIAEDETDYRLLSSAESAPISVTNKLSISEIIVKDKSQIINQVLDSTKIYKIDSQITLLDGESIIVPEGGLTLDGHGFNISTIFCSAANHTMFTSPVGGSGDLVFSHVSVTTLGANSKVFDIHDVDGTHAIEIEYVNFSGCTSLGKQDSYRQGTWTTVGVYGCDDGLQLSGSWNGYKISNSNCFGFNAAGTLIKKDIDTVFANRLFLNVNIDLPTGAVLCDFDNTNFSENELFQINSSIAKLNSVIDIDNTGVLVPNISANDLKSLWVGNIGLADSATEALVEDDTVTGAFVIDWLKDTYFLTMTGDTTFTEENLPASSKNTQEVKLYLTGEFTPSFPANWLTNSVGTYKGSDINEISIKYIKSGVYFVKISNSLNVYPAPILGSVVPVSLIPSATNELVLKGSFFTPEGFVLIDGQAVNSIQFDANTGDYILSVTTGALEGEFDITISNGTSVTFSNKLLINLGEVFIPELSDWINILSTPNLDTQGEVKLTSLNVSQGAEYSVRADYTKDFLIRFFPAISSINPSVPDDSSFKIITLKNAVSGADICSMFWRQSGANHYFRTSTGNTAALAPRATYSYDNTKMEYRNISGVLYLYVNGSPLESYGTLTEDVRIIIGVKQSDMTNIKYIELPI